MINIFEVTETNKMVEKENLDVRTITMGINLLDCASENLDEVNEKIYKKITTLAKDLVSVPLQNAPRSPPKIDRLRHRDTTQSSKVPTFVRHPSSWCKGACPSAAPPVCHMRVN